MAKTERNIYARFGRLFYKDEWFGNFTEFTASVSGTSGDGSLTIDQINSKFASQMLTDLEEPLTAVLELGDYDSSETVVLEKVQFWSPGFYLYNINDLITRDLDISFKMPEEGNTVNHTHTIPAPTTPDTATHTHNTNHLTHTWPTTTPGTHTHTIGYDPMHMVNTNISMLMTMMQGMNLRLDSIEKLLREKGDNE